MLPSAQEFNHIKENMSLAYLHGINAPINFALQGADKPYDSLGIDLMIINKVLGPGRTVASEGAMINVQLKAVSISSRSMLKEYETEIKYNLGKGLHPIGTHFLVVVILPEEEELESWRQITLEMLTLRGRAYYLHIKANTKGWVTIPKTSILNHDTLPLLFKEAKKDAL